MIGQYDRSIVKLQLVKCKRFECDRLHRSTKIVCVCEGSSKKHPATPQTDTQTDAHHALLRRPTAKDGARLEQRPRAHATNGMVFMVSEGEATRIADLCFAIIYRNAFYCGG